jgi:hypothetical protein
MKRHAPTLSSEPLLELPTIYEQLAITRHPYFESLTSATTNTTGISTLGGVWDLSGTISGGRVDGRINRLEVDAGLGDNVSLLWIGIADDEHISGTYDPVAECGDGTVIDSADTSIVSTTMETDFVNDATMQYRFSVPLSDFASTTNDFIGRHVILIRAKVDSGTEVGIRASTGWWSSPTPGDIHNLHD